MNKKCLFFINISFFEWNSLNTKEAINPFYNIYKRYYDFWNSYGDNVALFNIKTRSNKDNDCLFYKGLETKCKNICEKIKDELDIQIKKYIDGSHTFHYVKVKLNDCNNGKRKRLLCILVTISTQTEKGKNEMFEILFPIKYDDWH